MARQGEKVADGYIELHLDDSNLRVRVKQQGDASGKQFTEAFNQQLKKLTGKTVDLKADPRQALRQIDEVKEALREVSRASPTAEIHIDAEKALSDLAQFRRKFSDDFDRAAPDIGKRFGKGLTTAIGEEFTSLGRANLTPQMVAVLAGAATIAAPTIAGVLASAVVGGIGGGGIIGGVALAARDPQIQQAAKHIAATFTQQLEGDARGTFGEPIKAALQDVTVYADTARVKISQIFTNTAPSLQGLTRHILDAGDALLDSFVYASSKSAGPLDKLGTLVEAVAGSTARFIDVLALHSGAANSSMDDLTGTVENLMGAVTNLFDALLHIKEAMDVVDQGTDANRYALEELLFGIDLTADGYKRGSEAAELYRKGLIGAAGSADDYNHYLQENARKQAAFRGELDLSTDEILDMKAAQEALKGAQDALTHSLDALGGETSEQAQLATNLKKAMDNLYGAVIRQTDANEAYEASWDSLSEVIRDNGRTLDIHTKAGRANRDALEDLLQTTNEAYLADINAGVAIDDARKKHEARIKAIEREAAKLGLNKQATQDLINTYGKIPAKKETDIVLDGVRKIVDQMTDLYILQRLLAQGVPATSANVAAERGAIKNRVGPDKRGGGYAAGGEIEGPGTATSDSILIRGSKGEYMHRAAAVDYYGVQAMDAINAKRIPREALRGYATGGLIFPVDTGRWHWTVTASKTRVPSREEAMSKVAGQFGQWPSSPAAQRGDSGVWRRIVALVNASGIPHAFGNGYRPGDPLWHGSGRAVDWMGFEQNRLAQFFLQRQGQILEMIHRTSARDYAYTRGRNMGSFNEGLMNAHRNHLHIAMDNGGTIMPGWNSIYNGTGRPEAAVPSPMMDAVVERLDALIAATGGGLPRGDIAALANAIGVVIAGVLAGTVPQARVAARAVGKRPR